MSAFITVTLQSVTTVDDGLGNITETDTSQTYDRVRFAPRSSAERTDPRAPAVITGATLYRKGDFPVTRADAVVIADVDPMIDGTWQVDGDPGYWGGVGIEVAITRTP